MLYVVYCLDKPGHAAVRAENRSAHVEFLKSYPTEVVMEPGESSLPLRSAVVLNQIRSVDRQRLVRRLGHAGLKTMDRVDQAIQISLGLIKI